jgi:hypothetical protein
MPNPVNALPHVPCWDPWILKDDGIYRLFYLSGRTDLDPWWRTSWICGAQSADMLHWKHLGPVLEPLDNQGWESGRLFAGSAYKEADTYYLFYSAACESDIAKEAIGLATSSDGTSWRRFEQPLLSPQEHAPVVPVADVDYAGRCNWSDHLHWRDPYVVKEPLTQKYYLFFCASLRGASLYQGGVGVAIADHLAGPYQLLPPVAGPGVEAPEPPEESVATLSPAVSPAAVSPAAMLPAQSVDHTASWPFYHLERPQVIYFQGQYHLFFSCFKNFVNPLWLDQVGPHRVSDSTLYWYVSDSITGPFKPTSALPVVPGSETTGLYGTTFSTLPELESWEEIGGASEVKLTVLGWYSKDYRLAIAQEFQGIWDASGLRIVASAEG